MKIYQLATSIIMFQLVACHRPPHSTSSDAGGEGPSENGEEGVPTDLPCGGADLQTDNLNCGTCGNECDLWWPGTEYEAGACVDGKCTPHWTGWFPLLPPPEVQTCDEFCAYGNIPCVPRGCSGMTALVCGEMSDFGNLCDLADSSHHAMIEFGGECDEPIPYPKNTDEYFFINFSCCCDF